MRDRASRSADQEHTHMYMGTGIDGGSGTNMNTISTWSLADLDSDALIAPLTPVRDYHYQQSQRVSVLVQRHGYGNGMNITTDRAAGSDRWSCTREDIKLQQQGYKHEPKRRPWNWH